MKDIAEPAWPIVRQPTGGWPKTCVRLEFFAVYTLEQAIYELASYSRQMRIGVVANYNGRDLLAWPHQTCREIASFFQYVTSRSDPPVEPEAPQARWTALRKMSLLLMLKRREVEREDVHRLFGITSEELDSWEDRFARLGMDGLHSTKVQLLDRDVA